MPKADRTNAADGVALKLERSPSHLLHRALQHALDIYVDAAGAGAPTQRQFAVLAAVAENEGLTQTDLVRATGIDRSTLADLVARMIGKGLLARERSATDGRANTVRLTSEGRAALKSAAPKVAEADARILELVPARARESFLSVLLAFSEASEGDPAAAEAEVAALPAVKPDKKRKKAREGEPRPEKKRKKDKKKG
jgi:DNA-binding MarR family transcriptional regulator